MKDLSDEMFYKAEIQMLYERVDKTEAENKALKEALTYIATRNDINRFSLQKRAKETLSKIREEKCQK